MDQRPEYRRTNTIREYPAIGRTGVVVKIYEDYPLPMFTPLLCSLRDLRSVFGSYRCRTEERKTNLIRQAGYPLPINYQFFAPDVEPPMALMESRSDFVTLEDNIRSGIPMDESLLLIGKAAQSLRALHQCSTNSHAITHGDPFLENFVIVDDTVLPFDYEHEYPCSTKEALNRDNAFLVGHAHSLLREIYPREEPVIQDQIMDTLHTYYPELVASKPQLGLFAKLYCTIRFGRNLYL